jgi:hypothetical protein
MKRFTDTEKWNDAWFRKLHPDHKVFWDYICTRCDNSGVWCVDWELASFHTGLTFVEASVMEAMGDRIQDIGRSRWWVRKFIPFQFGELVEASRVHQSVVALMRKHGIYTLWIGYWRGNNTPKDKDKDTDKDLGKGSGGNLYGGGGMPPQRSEMLSLDQVKAAVMTSGIPDGFVELVYDAWQTRSGRDGANVPVEITAYVRGRWRKEEGTEWKNGAHRGQQKGINGTHYSNRKAGPNRNHGTLNNPARYSKENIAKLKAAQGTDKVRDAESGAP